MESLIRALYLQHHACVVTTELFEAVGSHIDSEFPSTAKYLKRTWDLAGQLVTAGIPPSLEHSPLIQQSRVRQLIQTLNPKKHTKLLVRNLAIIAHIQWDVEPMLRVQILINEATT